IILSSIYTLFIIFFFQAEDGIRDRNVTGVQTCALPIYYFRKRFEGFSDNWCAPVAQAPIERIHFRGMRLGEAVAADAGVQRRWRSEERRVGKEGRAGRGGEDGTRHRGGGGAGEYEVRCG